MVINPLQSKIESSPEDEIKELERKLDEKKRQFAEKQVETTEEKEILREVLQKQVEEVRTSTEEPSGAAPAVTHILTDDLKTQADEVKKKEKREEQIKHLVEIALTKSISEAVKVAQKSNPYLLDELHDHLVDDYYDKLIALRKIKKL
ncbi:MAG: hypothetical protein Q8R29_00800 [bacterium]|nr:hypothetical protein [bacterium]